MKKLIIVLIIVFMSKMLSAQDDSITYCRATHFEFGRVDSLTKLTIVDTIIPITNILIVEFTTDKVVVKAESYQEYNILYSQDLYVSDNVFESELLFSDQDKDFGIMYYHMNRLTGDKSIKMVFKNIYFKYLLVPID